MLVVWDEPKRLKNLQHPPVGHGLDFADARDRFQWVTALVGDAKPGVDGRTRFKAIGLLDGDLVVLIFALLGTQAISAISLRPASRTERKLYAQF